MNKESANKNPISSDIDVISLYREYRDYLKHEETLINYRTTWLITTNTLLMAALGVMFQKRLDQLANTNTDARVISSTLGVLLLVCLFGLAVSMVLFIAIAVGRKAMRNLEENWEREARKYTYSYKLPSLARGDPSRNWFIDFVVSYWPSVFLALWIAVLFIVFKPSWIAMLINYSA